MPRQDDVELMMLKTNITDQLNRLMDQIEDLENLKDELGEDEYQQEHSDTLEQLSEFQHFLEQANTSALTLDEISTANKFINAVLHNTFHTPEILRLFTYNDIDQLNRKLEHIERDYKLKNITSEKIYIQHKLDILIALKRLNVELNNEQEQFIHNNNKTHLQDEQNIINELSSSSVVKAASNALKKQ